MKLRDLILSMDTAEEIPILVDDVARLLESSGVCDEVYFIAADMDEAKVKGFITQWERLPAPYSIDSVDVTGACIYYSQEMNECWKRYVCAKEIVHLLDTSSVIVDSEDKLNDLMIGMSTDISVWIQKMLKATGDELQRPPLSASCMMDFAAEWLALFVLVPPTPRQVVIEKYLAKEFTDADVAYLFRIPQKLVPFVVSPVYDELVGKLLQ